MARERLGDILIKAGLLDEEGLQRALNEQQRWGGQLGRYLVELGLITEETLIRALSTQLKVPAVALDPSKLDVGVAKLIPREICERNNLVCFRADKQQKFLDVAMSNPSNLDAIDEVRCATRYNVRPYIAAPQAIDRAIGFVYYGDMGIGDGLDLAPSSTLRLDSRGSELLGGLGEAPAKPIPLPSEAPPPSAPAAPEPPAPAAPEGLGPPGLDVKVSLSEPGADLGGGGPGSPIELDDPLDVDFHITTDVPAVPPAPAPGKGDGKRPKGSDKGKSADEERTLGDQVARLEAIVSRNTTIIKALLETLVRKGLFTRKEIREILSSRH